jgi:hypothetical protein
VPHSAGPWAHPESGCSPGHCCGFQNQGSSLCPQDQPSRSQFSEYLSIAESCVGEPPQRPGPACDMGALEIPSKITKKRQNFDPSTPPASTENLHFMLNGETRRAPGPPVTRAQMAWEDRNQVSFAVPRYSHRQAWARAA